MFDTEQNHAFRDHFIELPFDLTDILFLTTANTLDTIPRPLLDRMEIIELPGYTQEEKVQIAKRHLIPKQQKKHGLAPGELKISDAALRKIISGYTREAGVRTLERQIAHVCRKADKILLTDSKKKTVSVTPAGLSELLGPVKYKEDTHSKRSECGVVNGLAWTSVGGEILEVEVNVLEGSGKLELTGNLGDVMKESAKAAISYIRSRADVLGIPLDFYKTRDIHIHFPEGAVPKDGPSAGVTTCTALVSALTGVPMPAKYRHDRRGDHPRPGAAHRRPAGKDHGGLPGQDEKSDRAQGKRAGYQRDRPDRGQRAGVRVCRAHG